MVEAEKSKTLDPMMCQLQAGDVVEICWSEHSHHGRRETVESSNPNQISGGRAMEIVHITGKSSCWSRYALKLVYRSGVYGAEQIKSMVVKPEAKQPEKKAQVSHAKIRPSDIKGIKDMEEMVKRMAKEIVGEPTKDAPKKSNKGVLTMADEKYIGMGFNDQL